MGIATRATHIPMTREAYENLPEGPPYYDYVDGVAIEVNRPSVRHQNALSAIEQAIRDHVRVGKLGLVAREISLELPGGAIYGPDLILVARDNQECQVRPRGDVVGVPDLIVEVLSPSTQEYDKSEKMRRYHRAGVQWIWLIAQDTLLVEELHWSQDGYTWILPDSDTIFKPRVFPGLELNLAALVDEENEAE